VRLPFETGGLVGSSNDELRTTNGEFGLGSLSLESQPVFLTRLRSEAREEPPVWNPGAPYDRCASYGAGSFQGPGSKAFRTRRLATEALAGVLDSPSRRPTERNAVRADASGDPAASW